jgi:hypothetical protein
MRSLSPRPLFALVLSAISFLASLPAMADEEPCAPETPCDAGVYFAEHEPSWVFRRGTYTHDPYTGARVAQYMRTPPVEPLDDERMVTSRYRRSRTQLRGIDGSIDTYYEVQAWGNGRGGIDAEWERFHDAWKESFLTGGYYNQGPGFGAPWGPGGGFGYGQPGYGFPGYGYGGPWQGGPWQGGPWHGGGPHGGGHHGGDHHGGGHHEHHDGHHGGGNGHHGGGDAHHGDGD